MEIETEGVRVQPYARWVEGVQSLEPAAWEMLLRYYAEDLRHDIIASLRKRGLPEDLADDVEQETWLTAVRKIGGFAWEDEGKFYHWLRVIALNHVRSYQRMADRHYSLEDVMTGELDDGLDRFLAAWGQAEESTEDAVVFREMYAALDTALRSLRPLEQEIFMRWLMGEPPRELALGYNLKPRSVSMLLLRTKDKLRANLQHLQPFETKDDSHG